MRRTGRWTHSYDGQWFDEFTVDVHTNTVNITLVDIYSGSMFLEGFVEVEFYTGKSKYPAGICDFKANKFEL